MSQLTAMELRKGMLVDNANRVCTVIYWNLWKSDRRSRVQMKVKDLLTGRITEITAQGDDKYNVLESEVMQLTHSYTDGTEEVFYTLDGNEEWRCPSVGLEDVLRWNAESYTGRVVDGKLDDRAGLDVARRADMVRDSSGHRAEGVSLVVVVGIDDRDRLRRPPRRDKLTDADELVGAKRQFR